MASEIAFKTLEKYLLIGSLLVELQVKPANLLKMNFFIGIAQGFWLQI